MAKHSQNRWIKPERPSGRLFLFVVAHFIGQSHMALGFVSHISNLWYFVDHIPIDPDVFLLISTNHGPRPFLTLAFLMYISRFLICSSTFHDIAIAASPHSIRTLLKSPIPFSLHFFGVNSQHFWWLIHVNPPSFHRFCWWNPHFLGQDPDEATQPRSLRPRLAAEARSLHLGRHAVERPETGDAAWKQRQGLD